MADYQFSNTGAELQNAANIALQRVAAPYSTSTNYTPGDYCSRNGITYRCITATSGTWTAARWTAVVMGDELSTRNQYNSIVSGTAVSVASDTDNFTQLQTISLDAGVWLIMAGASFTSNSSGFRQLGLTSTNSITVDRTSPLYAASSGAGVSIALDRAFYLSSAGTVYLWARQNSGSTLTCYPYIQAIRLR